MRRVILNLLHRYCNSCKKSIYLDEKETYVSVEPNKFLKRISPFILETKFYCIECNRNNNLKKLISNRTNK